MTHQNTWHGAGQMAVIFAFVGATLGEKIQENAGAIMALVSSLVMLYIHLRKQYGDSEVEGLERELRKVQLRLEIAKARNDAKSAETPSPTS